MGLRPSRPLGEDRRCWRIRRCFDADSDDEPLESAGQQVGKEDFQFLNQIGTGSFGKVYLVQKQDSQQLLAMKVLPKEKLQARKQKEHAMAELQVLRRNDHPFVVRLRYSFQTRTKLYVLTDYFPGGELWFHLRRHGRFCEAWTRFYAGETLLALEYLHARHVLYRDTKLENVLLDAQGHVRLTDFGLSKQVGSDMRTATFCGTPEYLAPEVVLQKRYNQAVDWWAFGAVVYEMLEGRPPFFHENRKVMFNHILACRYIFRQKQSSEAKALVAALLQFEPRARLSTASAVKAAPFFSRYLQDKDWARGADRRWTPPLNPLPPTAPAGDLSNIHPTFTQQPLDAEVADSHTPRVPFGDFLDFAYSEPPGKVDKWR